MKKMKKLDKINEAGVPMSTNYFIQRVGEFCMLIIGESVLSLLALSVEADYQNYLMFGGSAVIACNLYFHHFSTYPPDPSLHVLHDGSFDFGGCCYAIVLVRTIKLSQYNHSIITCFYQFFSTPHLFIF
jgi:hypothetical protein